MNRFSRSKKTTGPSSIVHVVLVGARDLIAADKGGTSDPYAVAELVEAETGNSLRPKRTKKTNTVKKTLEPTWNEAIVWDGVEENPSTLAVKVKVFDADMLSSEILGEITLPVADFTVEDVSDKWYPLEISGKMKEVKGEIHVQTRIDPPAVDSEADANAAEAAVELEERIIGKHGCKWQGVCVHSWYQSSWLIFACPGCSFVPRPSETVEALGRSTRCRSRRPGHWVGTVL